VVPIIKLLLLATVPPAVVTAIVPVAPAPTTAVMVVSLITVKEVAGHINFLGIKQKVFPF
jgi:hypothetical protein